MPGSHLVRWIILLCGALAAFGCTNTGTSQGSTGSLSLDLLLAGDIQIDVVTWEITGNGMEMSGSIDVAAPGSTASVEVYGLPVGEEPYSVELTAVSVDQEVTCGGSAEFDVEVGVSTPVMVVLNCKLPQQLGGVRVNGKFNICTELTKAVVSPLQTSVGNQISLSAQAFDEEGDAIQYIWTGTGGAIADPSAPSTTYTCQDVGEHEVMIMVTDNDVYCRMATWTVAVTCVEGDGGDLCEDVMCQDDGNECTETACNPANGACETSNVADGTDCDGGEGTCSGGQCVEVDLCEGVDCDDSNECTADACDPADGSCANTNVDNGTPCADATGMCVDGACMITDLCEGVICDDTGNECTVATCNTATGVCDTMNVADGTECNGGSGACSAGECVDNNLCDGVDCTSSNECVQDGSCDPADGQCIAGDNEPADTACSDGGTVCDGAGNCVECNSAGQCPDDGNECTAAVCDDSDGCIQNNVMDGLDCDFGGSAGICESGTCVAAPECAIDEDCDDGNPCSVGACPDGMCVFNEASDGTACDVSAGVPGTCAAGDCVGLCEGVDCTSGSQCVMDGTCDDQTGSCVVGGNEPAGADCSEDGGSVCDGTGSCVECNGEGQCASGEACVDNVCEPVVEVVYSQDFEALDPAFPSALGDDGWLYFGNVYAGNGAFKFGFGPFAAPTTTGQISAIATGEGGPEQGDNQLVVFSNYDCCGPGTSNEGHFNGTDLVETIVFQEINPIPGSFVGQTFTFVFDAKRGNISGATTAQAFIRTLDPGAGFATTNNILLDTTNLPDGWATYTLTLDLSDPLLEGQILQFGYSTVASNFESAGNFYDNDLATLSPLLP